MKERTSAKEGRGSDPKQDPMKEMRERYKRATEADMDNRDAGIADLKFVTVPGEQWDQDQKAKRKNRACYEFPILRSHWRQVVNDQKKARPGIKVRAVENGDADGAELRQGIIRNIESVSNAERAYDAAFELVTAAGFGAWEVTTKYSTDDAWDQDLVVVPIKDPLTSVWLDPDAPADDPCGNYSFIERTMPRDEFKAAYPDAEPVDFESAKRFGCADWYGQQDVRVAKYFRRVPVTKELLLLSDGRTVDAAEVAEIADEMQAQGITVLKSRTCKSSKVVVSIVAGMEEIDGPHDVVFDRIPIVPVWANRFFIDGKWVWCGMVRFSRDPQKLLNYNLTTAQEIIAKQPKSPYLVTPQMLEGKGVKQMWDAANAMDAPYLPYTPDPKAPNGRPTREPPPDMPVALTAMAQLSVDMLKASDGIYDASVGARSNETSGRAIMARQQEGDTATYDYQDALTQGIQRTGELLLSALPKVYDTPRVMRVLGKDGAEDWQQLYQQVRDEQTGEMKVVNDLSAGKYDVTVTTGPSYDTQRMEFVDALVQLGQGNEMVAAAVPDLVVGAMDFPKAEEAAERLKLMLPPQVQQAMAQKDQSPAVMQLRAQMQQMQQMAQQQMAEMQRAMQQLQAKAQSNEAAILREQNAAIDARIKWYEAETNRLKVIADGQMAAAELQQKAAIEFSHHLGNAVDREYDAATKAEDRQHQAGLTQMDQAHQAGMAERKAKAEKPRPNKGA